MGWAHGQTEILDITEKTESKKQEGSRKRGRTQLSWEECLKGDLRKVQGVKSREKRPITGTNGFFLQT